MPAILNKGGEFSITRRGFIKGAIAGAVTALFSALGLNTILAQAPPRVSPERIITEFSEGPFDVIVMKKGDYAIALTRDGDVIKSTDHAEVIQAAIDIAWRYPEPRGGRVYVVSDTYRIRRKIWVKDRVTINFGNSLLLAEIYGDAVLLVGNDDSSPPDSTRIMYEPAVFNVNIEAAPGYEGKFVGIRVYAAFMPIIARAFIRKSLTALEVKYAMYPLLVNVNYPSTYGDGVVLGEAQSGYYVDNPVLLNVQGGYAGSGSHSGVWLKNCRYGIINTWTVNYPIGLKLEGILVTANWIKHHSESCSTIIRIFGSVVHDNVILLSNTGGGTADIDTTYAKRNRIVFLGDYFPSVTSITPSTSPYTYQNKNPYPVLLLLVGGDPTVEYSPDGTNWYSLGTQRQVYLPPEHYVRISFTTAPTIQVIPLTGI